MNTAKLFMNGRSQAVRLPRKFAFEGISEVAIRKEGERVILEPVRKTWKSFADLERAGDDFMAERTDVMETDRISFE